ncbi:MAG: FKBP-type peptidyl-prolyl cis-trans isomerase [Rhodobacteraceae bacterium]|nr:FKBP-type peptidyl-prolyl cis-trans isomerase [Paracoccaceae bacterium]
MLKNLSLFVFLAILTLFNGSFAISSENELKITVEQEGSGDSAEIGMSVSVHYTGRLEDGTEFDSSIPRGQPFTFTLGSGQVIKGWDLGVKGMKIGEKRSLVIPPHLGYGMRGAGATIPPNATLIFDIELLEVAMPITLKELSPDDFIDAQENGGIVIDIRREEEWKETGILQGSNTITAFTKDGNIHPDFPKKFFDLINDIDIPILLYCRTGNRSSILGQALIDQVGQTNVSHLSGGIVGWKKQGHSTVDYKVE